MTDLNNDAYLLFLKQQQILKQKQSASNNRQIQQENQMVLKELQSDNSNSQANFLEQSLDFMGKQNQLNMNIHPNLKGNKK